MRIAKQQQYTVVCNLHFTVNIIPHSAWYVNTIFQKFLGNLIPVCSLLFHVLTDMSILFLIFFSKLWTQVHQGC